MSTYGSKRALLANIIDYAGTFPPAALSMEDALKEAARIDSELKHPWLFCKFALGLDHIKKLSPRSFAEAGSKKESWMFTALGSAIKDDVPTAEFSKTLEWDLREIQRINERGLNASTRYWVSHYENKIPKLALEKTTSAIQDYIKPAFERFFTKSHGTIQPFFEVSLEGKWQNAVTSVAECLAKVATELDENEIFPGLKIRTGGPTAATSEQVAFVLAACVEHGLRFKATQGLHQTLTHGKSLGFVNLFGALNLVQALGLEAFDTVKIKKCLDTENAKDFVFGEKSFRWNDLELDLDTIEAARKRHGASFGSCSIKEPDDSLTETFK